MHIQSINTEVVGCQIDTLKYFLEGKMLAVSVQNNLVWTLLHFTLDETQKMLLIHAARVMDMSVNFPRIVKVAGV